MQSPLWVKKEEPGVDTVKGSGIDIAKLHVGTELPVQAIHDMTVLTDSN